MAKAAMAMSATAECSTSVMDESYVRVPNRIPTNRRPARSLPLFAFHRHPATTISISTHARPFADGFV